MGIYYDFPRGSQCECLSSADITSISASRKNENFAANSTPANVAQTPMSHGFPATITDEGVVYGNSHASTDILLSNVRRWIASWPFDQCSLTPEQNAKRRKAFWSHVKRQTAKAAVVLKKTKGWSRLSSEERERLILDYAFRSESVAFTLNLTPEKQARYLKSERPAKALADAINLASKRFLGRAVPISLALEISPTGRLHVHGIATLERGEWKGFREALKSAGGKVEGSASGRQTDTRRLWSATGWTAYMAKAFHETAEALGTDKLFYQCNVTRAGAKAEYEASLQRQKAARRASR